MLERAQSMVRTVIGRTCWSAIASVKTDWVIALDLGEKVRRAMRLANPRLSFLQRTYEGEHSFLIECTWRLDGEREVIASCFDSNQPGGLMHRALADLEGRAVSDVRIESVGCDLLLSFEGGLVLRTLATETDPRRKRGNWSFWSPEGLVTIGPRGALSIESSAEAEQRVRDLKRKLAQEEDDIVSPLGRDRDPPSEEPDDSPPDPES
jgi:hypothetical protein